MAEPALPPGFEYEKAATDTPALPPGFEPEGQPPSTLSDIGKAAVTGPLKGLGKFLLAPGEAEAALSTAASPTGEPVRDVPTQAGVERRIGQAETFPGRLVQNVGEMLGNPASWIGPGGLITKGASIIGSGIGGTIGEEVGGPLGGLIGGVGGSLAVPSTLSGVAARQAAAATRPTVQGVRAAGHGGYNMARQLNTLLPPRDVGDLGRIIRRDLTNQYGHGPIVEPQTYRTVDQLIRQETATAPVRRRMLGTDDPSTNALINTRKRLTNISRNNPATSEGLAARRAVDYIDGYLNQFPGLNRVLQQARGDWRASKLAGEIDDAVAHAGRITGNPATNLRAGIRGILENDRIPKTPEQRAAMERVIRDGRWLEAISHHWHHGFGVAAIMAVATGHLEALLPIAGAAIARNIPRRLDAWGRMRGINRLREDILRNAPSGGGPIPRTPLIPRNQIAPALLRGALNPSLSDLSNGNSQ